MPTRDDHRRLELDDLAASQLLTPRRRAGPAVKIAAALAVLAVVTFLAWQNRSGPARTMLTPDNDEFKTTSYQPPVINAQPAAINPGRLVVEPPPAPPPPPPPSPPPQDPGGRFPPQPAVISAPPPAAVVDDGEARRLAEEERRRSEEEERRRWERLRSPMMIIDSGSHGATGPADPTQTGGIRGDDGDPNTRYLQAKAAEGVETARATRNRRIDALVAQGTIIRGVLETAIQSDLPGMVRAVTTEDVWSFDGRRVLVPSGTRLIGEYKSGLATGPDQQTLYARQIAAQQASTTVNSLANEALRNSINIPPTIHVDQGGSIAIFVRRDLDFSSLYADPVREAMKELRSGRARAVVDRDAAADGAPRAGAPAARGLVTKP